jgi:hypothetical protein
MVKNRVERLSKQKTPRMNKGWTGQLASGRAVQALVPKRLSGRRSLVFQAGEKVKVNLETVVKSG